MSHRPKLYALVVGLGVVFFWRGVWLGTDFIFTYFGSFQNGASINYTSSIWWDAPLSILIGIIILYFTGAFVSSFIGNELILSGLRGEKRLNQKTETEVKTEAQTIDDIKKELDNVRREVEQLEKKSLEK